MRVFSHGNGITVKAAFVLHRKKKVMQLKPEPTSLIKVLQQYVGFREISRKKGCINAIFLAGVGYLFHTRLVGIDPLIR